MLNKLIKQIIKNVYTKWLKEDKLIMLEGWRRDGLSLEQLQNWNGTLQNGG